MGGDDVQIVGNHITVFGWEIAEIATLLTILGILWGVVFASVIKPARERAQWRHGVDHKLERQVEWNDRIASDVAEIRKLAEYTSAQLKRNGGTSALDAVHRIEQMLQSVMAADYAARQHLHEPERSHDD